MKAVSRLSLDGYHIPYKLTETVNDPLPKSQVKNMEGLPWWSSG